MTVRLRSALGRAREQGRAALVVYFTAGDPSLQVTPSLLAAAGEAGADVIELGVPFSDPTADGVAIQRASERALRSGTTLRGVIAAVRAARDRGVDTPIVLFGYYNPILAYGEERLCADAAAAGADGLLVVDLPPEEGASLHAAARAHDLDWIPLVAPTSTGARVAAAARLATAFLYYVSLTGVTGAAAPDLVAAAAKALEIRTTTSLPIALGFGIKTPEDVAELARTGLDAIVVGSAIVTTIATSPDPATAVRNLVTRLRAATNR